MKPGIHPDYHPVISAYSHPFWTGTRRVVESAGQVEKFNRRYGNRAMPVDLVPIVVDGERKLVPRRLIRYFHEEGK